MIIITWVIMPVCSYWVKLLYWLRFAGCSCYFTHVECAVQVVLPISYYIHGYLLGRQVRCTSCV